MKTETERKRVLVIGIDGATLDIIEAMQAKGELPSLSQMMKEGSSGALTSVIPPLSPPAWSTFLTGKNPGKHGIYHFLRHPYATTNASRFTFYNHQALKAPSLPELLKNSSLQVGLVNVCPTYPPFPLNGFMISGMDAPSEIVEYTYPPEIKRELAAQGIAYQIDYNQQAKWRDFFFGGEQKICEAYLAIERKRAEAAHYLMTTKPWDLFIVVFNLPDRIHHLAWQYQTLTHGSSHPASALAEAVPDAYRLIDDLVGKLRAEQTEDTYVFVLSDHGYCSTQKMLFLNKWLCDQGFLCLKTTSFTQVFWSFGLNKGSRPLEAWLSRWKLGFLRPFFPTPLLQKNIRGLSLGRKNLPSRVDWNSTVAYAGCGYGIYINLKGRTANGIVEPGSYERLREEIAACLTELKDPDTGEQVIARVFKKEEIYSGEQVFYGPDLLLEPQDYQYVINDTFGFHTLFEPYYAGAHHPDGFFVLTGPRVKRNHILPSANLWDMAPTILYLLNHPIPADMDGRVLEECFDRTFP